MFLFTRILFCMESAIVKLCDCKVNKKYKIVGFLDGIEKGRLNRLLELGLTVGQDLKVDYFSMLKKVMLIEIRSFSLSLRKDIAKFVVVKECKN